MFVFLNMGTAVVVLNVCYSLWGVFFSTCSLICDLMCNFFSQTLLWLLRLPLKHNFSLKVASTAIPVSSFPWGVFPVGVNPTSSPQAEHAICPKVILIISSLSTPKQPASSYLFFFTVFTCLLWKRLNWSCPWAVLALPRCSLIPEV